MDCWDFGWVPSVQDVKSCRLAYCDECENWIQTSSHCNAGIPFTRWLMFSDDVAVFRCAWRSNEWYCKEQARRRGNVFLCEEFDACHPDWDPQCSTGCGTLDDPNCNALDNHEVVGFETRNWETTCSDTKWECTPRWSRMDLGRAS